MTGLAFTDQLQNKKQANQSETNTRYTQAITWSWIWLIWNGASVIAACFAFAACVLAALAVSAQLPSSASLLLRSCGPSAQWRYKLDNSSRHHRLDARGPG